MLLLVAFALPCEPEPLRMRTTQPAADAIDVPIDVRVAVSFIGFGTADEYAVRLELDGAEVPVARTTWCYEHEGVAEVHCWHALKPLAALEPGRTYSVRATSTATWSGTGSAETTSVFTTGNGLAPALAGAPTLAVTSVVEEAAATDCDYPIARRYVLEARPASGVPDTTALSLFHLQAEAADGTVTDNIHSMLVSNPAGEPEAGGEYKQFLDGAKAWSDCFFIEEENAAGARSERIRACFAPDDTDTGDTDTSDTADSPDTDTADGAPGDTDTGEAAADSGAGVEDPDAPAGGPPRGDCPRGCAGAPAALLFAAALTAGRRGSGVGVNPADRREK